MGKPSAVDNAIFTSEFSFLPMLQRGNKLNEYEIIEHIGSGSFGHVYKAKGISAGDIVALKVCSAPNPEAGVLAQLEHPTIISVIKEFSCDAGHVTAFAFVEGVSLADLLSSVHRLSRTRLTIGQALDSLADGSPPTAVRGTGISRRAESFVEFSCRTVLQIAQALVHAHSRQIFHKDVKPENILIANNGSAILIDWGVAAGESEVSNFEGGTLSYMRNERLAVVAGVPHLRTGTNSIGLNQSVSGGDSAAASGARDDLFALGVVLYELVVGDNPFPVSELDSTIVAGARETLANRSAPAEMVSNSKLSSPALKAIVAACVCADQEATGGLHFQYSTMQQLAGDLENWLDRKPLRHVQETVSTRTERWFHCYRRTFFTLAAAAMILASAFGLDRFVTGLELSRVEQIRGKILNDELAGELPSEVKDSIFGSGIFPDSDALRNRRIYVAHGLAAACLSKEIPHSAVGLLQEAIALSPEDGDLQGELGFAWFQLKDTERAIETLSGALLHNCKRANVLTNRGVAHAASGDAKSARLDFEAALKISPAHKKALQHLKKLNSIASEVPM